ncbi:MAG TPA: isocitrate/isopropylmalate dehydrogenase family protein [Usitatibacter sp.]|nr:isocitrate/isopropylmalate dehydrogenase family protein [Usitatibacter sp.]
MTLDIVLIPGDGIGPEVMGGARQVVEAAGVAVRWVEGLAGAAAGKASGTALPEATIEAIRRHGVALKGPTATPFGGNYRIAFEGLRADGSARSYPSITVALRKELDLFVNVRPVKNYPGIRSRYDNVDLVIFRENTEDLYLSLERMRDADTAEATKVITRGATRRVARFAIDYMRRTGRKRVAIVHKANILKLTDGMFLEVARGEVEGAGLEASQRVVDALCLDLVMNPEAFDCLLLPNLYGDIVSDLAAGLVGGLGVAPGANFGEGCAMFEAVHGTAPDIAGRDVANPTAAILSAVMMLRYLGEAEAASRIEAALAAVLADPRLVTPDLGGSGGTRGMVARIVERLTPS